MVSLACLTRFCNLSTHRIERLVDFRGPPRVLFIWPRIFRMKCVLTGLDITHREFSFNTLATTQLVAKLTLEGELERRLLSSTVARFHTLRYPEEGDSSATT